MNKLIEEIQEDINWRISQIADLKTIPLRYEMKIEHQNILIFYSVLSIYAIWEGYINKTFELLNNFLNQLNLNYANVHFNIITHSVDNKCNLNNARKDFKAKIKLVDEINKILDTPFIINAGIPTKSNVNWKVTNKILERYNIHPLDNKYENILNKLLFFRNKIAHGENSIQVKREHVDEFSILVQDVMSDVMLNIKDYIENKKYFIL